MQALRTSTKPITAQQSLTVVKTLLQAGLGCITYLRGLLPADNFNNSSLISSNDHSLSFTASDVGDGPESVLHRDRGGMRVMTITRGFTEEADKLLNFLESGIFDALEKQYLRKFIFAVYVDENDPNNIVEAYTFNFDYHALPDGCTKVPILSIDDDMNNVSLNDRRRALDPAAEATKIGKMPTFSEVKKSLRGLVKRLITATTSMENLPCHRYASFKLFYHDDTPDDYEPPHFRSGNFDKDRWTFSTHNVGEVPEKISLGKLSTPYHGVEMTIASVASYLPAVPVKENHSRHPVNGNSEHVSTHTAAQEAGTRRHEMELLRTDAEERRVVWSADADDPDAEGEIDPDYASNHADTNDDSGVGWDTPLGIRNMDGDILPLSESYLTGGNEEIHFGGAAEIVPSRVGELQRNVGTGNDIAETQPIAHSQEPPPPLNVSDSAGASGYESLPPSDMGITQTSSNSQHIDTQMLKDITTELMGVVPGLQDIDMLDMETQMMNATLTKENDNAQELHCDDNMQQDALTPEVVTSSSFRATDKGLNCACGLTMEDDACFCDAGCGRWYHIWCSGFHSVNDKRIPSKYMCMDCRLHHDDNWPLMEHDLYPQIMSRYNILALFRRAIKVVETRAAPSASAFAEVMGCDISLASQLFSRLKKEGFIVSEADVLADPLANLSGKKSHKAKSKQRRKIQKVKYIFMNSSKRTQAYADYFTPTNEVESRLMDLSELMPNNRRGRSGNLEKSPSGELERSAVQATDSPNSLPATAAIQTENETTENETTSNINNEASHALVGEPGSLKRKGTARGNEAEGKKKIKISLAPAVDLGE